MRTWFVRFSLCLAFVAGMAMVAENAAIAAMEKVIAEDVVVTFFPTSVNGLNDVRYKGKMICSNVCYLNFNYVDKDGNIKPIRALPLKGDLKQKKVGDGNKYSWKNWEPNLGIWRRCELLVTAKKVDFSVEWGFEKEFAGWSDSWQKLFKGNNDLIQGKDYFFLDKDNNVVKKGIFPAKIPKGWNVIGVMRKAKFDTNLGEINFRFKVDKFSSTPLLVWQNETLMIIFDFKNNVFSEGYRNKMHMKISIGEDDSETIVSLPKSSKSPMPKGNLMPGDSSFETGRGNWVGGHGAEVVIDNTTAFNGKQCLRVDPLHIPRWNRQVWGEYVPCLEDTPYTFSIYARGSSATNLRLIAQPLFKGEPYWYSSPLFKLCSDWKRYELKIPSRCGSGQLRLMLETKGDATYYIDAVQFEAGEKVSSYQPSELVSTGVELGGGIGNVFFTDELIKPVVSLYNTTGIKRTIQFTCRIKDYYDKILEEKTEEVSLLPRANWQETLRLGKWKEKGFFLLSYEAKEGDSLLSKGTKKFCIVSPPVVKGQNEDFFFGMQSGTAKLMEPMSRIGVKCIKSQINWTDTEPEKGKFDWAFMDDQINSAVKNNLSIVIHFAYTPVWAREGSLGDFPRMKDFGDFVRVVVNRYKDRVKYWEIIGEPYSKCQKWGTTIEESAAKYAEMVKVGYTTAKEVDPNCVILACGVWNFTDGFIFSKEVFRLASDFIDIFPIHPYASGYNFSLNSDATSPEAGSGVREKLEMAQRLITECGGRQKVWVGEVGWGLPNEVSLSPRAKKWTEYMVRIFLLARSVNGVERCSFYVAHDWARRSNVDLSFWQRLGLQPRPAVAACANVAGLLERTESTQKLNLGRIIQSYAFKKNKGGVIALWTTGNEEINFQFDILEKVKVIDIMGNPVSCSRKKGKINLSLNSSPLFVKNDYVPFEELVKSVERGKVFVKYPLQE